MVDTYDDLDGHVALVTGANRGVGRQVAAALRDLGATVYAGTRSQTHDAPDGTEHVLVDVTQEGDVEAAVDGIYADQQRLDVLVNAAEAAPADHGDDESASVGTDVVGADTRSIDRTLAVNLRGPLLVCKHAVPLLVQDAGGRVVNVSSGLAQLADMGDGSPAYRVSKVGLNGLTAYLDAEYNDAGLVANSALARGVETERGDGADGDATGADTATWLARFTPDAPSGRFWKDREVVDW